MANCSETSVQNVQGQIDPSYHPERPLQTLPAFMKHGRSQPCDLTADANQEYPSKRCCPCCRMDTLQGVGKDHSHDSPSPRAMPAEPTRLTIGARLPPSKLDGLQHLQALTQVLLEAVGMSIPRWTAKAMNPQNKTLPQADSPDLGRISGMNGQSTIVRKAHQSIWSPHIGIAHTGAVACKQRQPNTAVLGTLVSLQEGHSHQGYLSALTGHGQDRTT